MKSDLNLNLKVIDYEHEKIFSLLHELQAGPVIPSKVINVINEYTERHFMVEEEMMAAYDYPELEAHRTQHNVFRTKIHDLIEAMGVDELTKTKAIGVFLASWLENHVSRVDKHMADYIHEQDKTT